MSIAEDIERIAAVAKAKKTTHTHPQYSETLAIHMSPEMYDSIRREAAAVGESMGAVVRQAIREKLIIAGQDAKVVEAPFLAEADDDEGR